MIVFGPVSSRRLGQSMGINNIPAKNCPYSCVYCQVGRTTNKIILRRPFYDPEKIFKEVNEKYKKLSKQGKKIDYISFVPDGEPTLDKNLRKEIELLKTLKVKIAVLTNSSLINKEDVRSDLASADLVSLKIDAITNHFWQKINKPHYALNLSSILEGILEFSKSFQGDLITETMIIKGINDNKSEFERMAEFLKQVNPNRAYIAVPTRPPTEKWAIGAEKEALNKAHKIFCESLGLERVELLVEHESGDFIIAGDFEDELLSITSVHPIREDIMKKLLEKNKKNWKIIDEMIEEKKLIELNFDGRKYYKKHNYVKDIK